MHQSHVIEIDGNFVGAALTDGIRFQFVAVDVRLDDLDTSVWPTLAELRSAVRRTLAGESIGPRQLAAHKGAPRAADGDATSLPRRANGGAEHDGGATDGLQRTVRSLREQVLALASIEGLLLGVFCKEGVISEAAEERLFAEIRNALAIEPEPARLEWERIVAAVQSGADAANPGIGPRST